MKQHRMFSLYVIDSDAFLDMPLSAQALYFHLCMRADDDGFINNPKRIQRTIGGSDDDLKLLIAKQFILPFDTGVIVVRHWKIHNYIRKDMYKPTLCDAEAGLIEETEAGTYQLRNVNVTEALQERTENVPLSISKVKVSKDKGREVKQAVAESQLSEPVKEKLFEFLDYRKEIKKPYNSNRGIKALITQVERQEQQIGATAVIAVIDKTMENGWQGLYWDKASKPKEKTGVDAIFGMIGEGL